MKKILIVVTSHSELGQTGEKTGYYLSEVAHPYLVFKKSDIEVDFASIKGGEAPVDPSSLDFEDQKNKEFFETLKGKEKLANTTKLSDVDPKNYSAVFFAGGHGTMWDFPDSEDINSVATSIYENGGVVSAVCHGPAALLNIKSSDGEYLIKDKNVAAFSNAEEEAAEVARHMPFALETELVKRGAKYSKSDLWQEKVVTDARLVTGQNPASAEGVAEAILKSLK